MERQPAFENEVRTLQAEDISRVAEIHSAALPEDFCTRLGPAFLRCHFYPHFLECSGATGFVAGGGTVDGFVIGGPGAGYYTDLVRRRWAPLFKAVALSIARHPSWFGYYLDVARVLLRSGVFHPGKRDAELFYIAVDPAAQGRSLGTHLTRALLARLATGPYDRCVVKTLAATPENTRFYEGLGFSVVAEEQGRVWLAHPLDISSRLPEPNADA